MTALMGVDARLRAARLAAWVDAPQDVAGLDGLVGELCAGGVDLLLVRPVGSDTEQQREVLRSVRRAAAPHQALVGLVDVDPVRAGELGTDVLHLVGGRGTAADARPHLHRWARLGRSVGSEQELRAAAQETGLDYLWLAPPGSGPDGAGPADPGPGPVEEAPPDPALVRSAVAVLPPGERAGRPWFVGCGTDVQRVEEALAAGARRLLVGGEVTGSPDPRGAARALRSRLNQAWRQDPAMAGTGLTGTPRARRS